MIKKYKQFNESVLNNTVDDLLNNNKDKYIIKINEEVFNNIINQKCDTYLEVSKDVKFYRGDKNLTDDYYILNSYNTIPKYQPQSNSLYAMTIFLSSHYWTDKNLPLKPKSIDMVSDLNITNMYGNSYEVIPIGNPKIVCNDVLFGNYVPKRFKEEIYDDYHISSFFDDIFDHLFLEKYDKQKLINYIDKINDEFEKKEFIILNDSYYKDLVLKSMEKNNMSFKELMDYIFAPESYTTYEYEDIKKCNFDTIFAYITDSVLLKKIK